MHRRGGGHHLVRLTNVPRIPLSNATLLNNKNTHRSSRLCCCDNFIHLQSTVGELLPALPVKMAHRLRLPRLRLSARDARPAARQHQRRLALQCSTLFRYPRHHIFHRSSALQQKQHCRTHLRKPLHTNCHIDCRYSMVDRPQPVKFAFFKCDIAK